MPEFDHSTTCKLKAAMKARSAKGTYYFTEIEAQAIATECNISKYKVLKWIENKRMRYRDAPRMDWFLNSTSSDTPKYKIKRCHIHLIGITQDTLSSFAATPNVEFIEWVFSSEKHEAEIFVAFNCNKWTSVLSTLIQTLNPNPMTVNITTFQNNDGGLSAADALKRVRYVGITKPGYVHHTQGPCCKDITRVLNRPSACVCGRQLTTQIEYSHEFDVVKKHRRMEEADSADGDSDPDALASFQSFFDAVWPTLHNVHEHNERIKQEELTWATQQSVLPPQDKKEKIGFVYAAWNPCFNELVKIGATLRDTPYHRLKELSGSNVPEQFELVACIPSKDPFALEKKIHTHFHSVRIIKGNNFSEFFRLSRDEISEFFSHVISDGA